MVEQVTFQTIFQFLQTVGILTAVYYYIMTLRNTSKTRQRELIYQKLQSLSLEYARTFNEVMLMRDWDDAEDWERKYDRHHNLEAYSKWNYITRLYGLAGLFLREGANPDLIFTLYPDGAVINLWELYEPVVQHIRERTNNPKRLTDLEFLYTEAKKRRPELHLTKY